MSFPSSKISELTTHLTSFCLKANLISDKTISRFISNLKSQIQVNLQIHLDSNLSEECENRFNPLMYKKFLTNNLIELSHQNFNIDFRELLVNNQSFGNPIGCLMLIEAAIDASPEMFESANLESSFPYLVLFSIVNDNINPLIFKALNKVFNLALQGNSKLTSCNLYNGTIRAEFWVTKLYELTFSVEEASHLFFKAVHHYVLRDLDLVSSVKFLRRVTQWVISVQGTKGVESLYKLQSLNLLIHLKRILEQEEEGETCENLNKPFINKSFALISQQIMKSNIFFLEHFLKKIQSDKNECALVTFISSHQEDFMDWGVDELNFAIVALFRHNLKLFSKENNKSGLIYRTLLQGEEVSVAKVIQTISTMITQQSE